MTNNCTHAQAIALKEIGFDMEVMAYYDKRNKLCFYVEGTTNVIIGQLFGTCVAPTRSEVLQWAREKKGMFAVVLPVDDWNSWHYYILGRDCMSPFFEMYASLNDDLEYLTYPEAEDALVWKIIELIKNK